MNRPSPDDMKAMQVMEYVEQLEKENKELKEHKENLIRADKKKTEYIDRLEEKGKYFFRFLLIFIILLYALIFVCLYLNIKNGGFSL